MSSSRQLVPAKAIVEKRVKFAPSLNHVLQTPGQVVPAKAIVEKCVKFAQSQDHVLQTPGQLVPAKAIVEKRVMFAQSQDHVLQTPGQVVPAKAGTQQGSFLIPSSIPWKHGFSTTPFEGTVEEVLAHVILNEVKDLLRLPMNNLQILRFAQNDKN